MCSASAPLGDPSQRQSRADQDMFKTGLGTDDGADRPLPVDLLLKKLQKDGVCLLASQLSGLNPFQAKAVFPGIDSLQKRFVKRVPDEGRETLQPVPISAIYAKRQCSDMTSDRDVIGNTHSFGTIPSRLLARLDILEAPAAFSLPALAKRRFHGPFVVKLRIYNDAPLSLRAIVSCYAVDENVMADLTSWTPCNPGSEGLLHHKAESGGVPCQSRAELLVLEKTGARPDELISPTQCKYLSEGDLECEHLSKDVASITSEEGCAKEWYAASLKAEFHGLAFATPSKSRPRWLVFAAWIVNDGGLSSSVALSDRGEVPVLCTAFLVPTIVMSREADQMDRATSLLWEGAPPVHFVTEMSYQDFRKHTRRLLGAGLTREARQALIDEDYRSLIKAAGLFSEVKASVNASQAQALYDVHVRGLQVALQALGDDYCRRRPRLVCPLSMSVGDAQEALRNKPVGCFLFSFNDTQPGGMALVVVDAAASCKTIKVAPEQVARELKIGGRLAGFFERVPEAQYLLDLEENKLYDKRALLAVLHHISHPANITVHKRVTTHPVLAGDDSSTKESLDTASSCQSPPTAAASKMPRGVKETCLAAESTNEVACPGHAPHVDVGLAPAAAVPNNNATAAVATVQAVVDEIHRFYSLRSAETAVRLYTMAHSLQAAAAPPMAMGYPPHQGTVWGPHPHPKQVVQPPNLWLGPSRGDTSVRAGGLYGGLIPGHDPHLPIGGPRSAPVHLVHLPVRTNPSPVRISMLEHGMSHVPGPVPPRGQLHYAPATMQMDPPHPGRRVPSYPVLPSSDIGTAAPMLEDDHPSLSLDSGLLPSMAELLNDATEPLWMDDEDLDISSLPRF